MYKEATSGILLSGIIFLLLLCFMLRTEAFPSGAPVEACESLLPRHVHTSPKNATESPFKFIASASRFYPDSKRRKIKVQIKGAPFKGFFIVALDAETHQRLGSWMESRGMDVLPCSGVTHSDGRPKLSATLVWEPPPEQKKGEVIFMGTILESFSSYYSGLLASVRAPKTTKLLKRSKREDYGSSYNNATIIEYL